MSSIAKTDNATRRGPPFPFWFPYNPTSGDLDIVDTYGMPAAQVDILTTNSALVCKVRRSDASTTTVTVPTVANGFQVPYTILGQVATIVAAGSSTTSIIVYLPEMPRLK